MVEERKSVSFKIKMPLMSMGDVSVVVDGIDLTDKIRSLTLHAVVGGLTELTIKFSAGVDIEGEAILNLLDYTGYPVRDRLSDKLLIEKDTEDEI